MNALIKLSNNLYIKGFEKESLSALEIKEAIDKNQLKGLRSSIVDLADALDKNSLHKEADLLDGILNRISLPDIGSAITKIPGLGPYVETYVAELKKKLAKKLEEILGFEGTGFMSIFIQEMFAGLTIEELLQIIQTPSCELITEEVVSAVQRAALRYNLTDAAMEQLQEFVLEMMGAEKGGKLEYVVKEAVVSVGHRAILSALTENTIITKEITNIICDTTLQLLETYSFFKFIKGKSPKEVYDELSNVPESIQEGIEGQIDQSFPDVPGFDYKNVLDGLFDTDGPKGKDKGLIDVSNLLSSVTG